MNSSQRRIDQRRWKFKVVTVTTYENYVTMWEWLDRRHGKKVQRCGWRERCRDFSFEEMEIIWEFLHKRDAVEFALVWAK